MSLTARLPRDEAISIFNPHIYSSVMQYEKDKLLLGTIAREKRKMYVLAGGTTSLDKAVVKMMRDEYTDAAFDHLPKLDRYIAVLGDVVLVSKLQRNGNRFIDELFQTYQTVAEAQLPMCALDAKIPVTVTVARNARLSLEWRKRIQKYFQ